MTWLQDIKQQEYINALEKKVANLTHQLTVISSDLHEIHTQVLQAIPQILPAVTSFFFANERDLI